MEVRKVRGGTSQINKFFFEKPWGGEKRQGSSLVKSQSRGV